MQCRFRRRFAPQRWFPAITSRGWGVAENGRAVAGCVAVDTNGPLPGETGRVRPFIWTPENGSQVLPVPAA
jgi:hypothetical protein